LRRHDRFRFALLGLPAILNALAMFLVAFNVSFRTSAGYLFLVPLAVALVCLMIGAHFAIKRGRDLGWSAWSTMGILIASLVFFPAILAMLCVLLFLPARQHAERFGAPPTRLSILSWLAALPLATMPWLLALLTKTI
jgi:uncharacterized membrane protein YhaH (DUF805 family)